MVGSVDGNFKPIKLKGTDKQIDMNNLTGLRKTQQNASVFSQVDKNGDGIINENEVSGLQNMLKGLGGRDNKISAKDFHGTKETNQQGFNALKAIADQQASIAKNQDYTDGNTTIHADGSKTERLQDGNAQVTNTYNASSAKINSSLRTEGDKNTFSEFLYEGDVVTTYQYDGTNADGALEQITVAGQKENAPEIFEMLEGEATTETTFKTEADFVANRPESKTFTYEDGTSITVTYEYNEDGTITANIPGGENGDKTVKYKEVDGKLEIVEDNPEPRPEPEPEPEQTNTTYTVVKGDSLWKIAKKQLGEGATNAQIANYVDEIMKANPNLKWDNAHYNVMIHAGDEIKLPETQKAEETTTEQASDIASEETEGAKQESEQTNTTYTVVKGDSLWKIARNHLGEGATNTQIANYVDDIMKANPNLKWDDAHYNVMIHPGDEIKLPETQKTDSVQTVEQPQNPETATVECKLSEEEKQQFDTALNTAKQTLIDNKEELGLTDTEITFIQNAITESIEYGAARADKDSQSIKFNYNGWGNFDSGNFAKVMIHEVTHMSIDKENSVAQERECETRAIKCALQLLEKGVIEDFDLPGGVKLSDLKDETALKNFIEKWLTDSDYRNRLPEET